MNQQEMMMEMQDMAKQAEQIEQHCQFLEQQAGELEKFKKNLDDFDPRIGGKLLSSFGKGVFMETELKADKLLVEVGAGVLVRKTPQEVSEILNVQIKALLESREYFRQQFDLYSMELQKKMSVLEKELNKNKQE